MRYIICTTAMVFVVAGTIGYKYGPIALWNTDLPLCTTRVYNGKPVNPLVNRICDERARDVQSLKSSFGQ